MSNIHINCRLFIQLNSYSFWKHYPACFHGSLGSVTPLLEEKFWNSWAVGISLISRFKQDTWYLGIGWFPSRYIHIYCLCLWERSFSLRQWRKSLNRYNKGQKKWRQGGHVAALIIRTVKSGNFTAFKTNLSWKVSFFIYTNAFSLHFHKLKSGCDDGAARMGKNR